MNINLNIANLVIRFGEDDGYYVADFDITLDSGEVVATMSVGLPTVTVEEIP